MHRNLIDEVLASQSLDDIGLMIYTSGSTGKPKGAMISYGNIRAVAPGIIERLGLDEGSRHLSYLPLCHVAEQMLTTFTPIYLGSQVNFGESLRTVQEDLREVAPTLFLGVPRIWEKLHASINIRIMRPAACAASCSQGTGRLRVLCPISSAPADPGRELALLRSTMCWSCRALQNYIGLREAEVALTGAAPIAPERSRFFRHPGRAADRGLRPDRIHRHGHRPRTRPCERGHRWAFPRRACSGALPRAVTTTWAASSRSRATWCSPGTTKTPRPRRKASRTAAAYRRRGAWVDGQIKIVDRLKDIMITAGGKNLTPSEIENAMKASPYIKECIVVADGRNFVSALIQIDFETVGKWAERNRMAFTHFRSLVENPQVRELVAEEINKANSKLAQVSQVRKFHLLTKELDHDDGEVTATMKVRRSSIYKTYEKEIEAMYGKGGLANA